MPVISNTRRLIVVDKQNVLFRIRVVITSFLVSFLPIGFVNAQAIQIDKPALPIDSLKKELPLLRDSARINCLNELARSYLEVWQFDSARSIMGRAYNDAASIKYIKGLGDACIQYGMLYFFRYVEIVESEKYFREAIYWYNKIQNYEGLGQAFRGLGQAVRGQGGQEEATKAFEQSAFYFRKTSNLIMLADLTDQFSSIYGAKGDFEKQFEFVKKSLKEKKRINDNRGLIRSYYLLAHIYQSIGDYETALGYFRQSYRQAFTQSLMWKPNRSMGNIFLSLENYDSSLFYFRQGADLAPPDLVCLTGLGKIAVLRKEYDKGLSYLQDASAGFNESKNYIGAVPAMIEMAKAYIGKKNYNTALQYARACLAIAMKTGDKSTMQQVYEINWNIYKELKKTDSAYFYFEKFVSLKDSLEDARLKLQYLQKLALYQVEAKEEQQQARIDLLNKDNQLKQQQLQEEALMKKILIACMVILVLLGIIIFRNIILNRRNEKLRLENELKEQQLEAERKQSELQKQTSELEMQALRAQMNPHFIFNCLNSINRFILKNETETASDYLTKFSRLIRMVLNNSQHKYITLSEELDCLELYIQMEQLRVKYSFRYKIKCHADLYAEEILVPPLLLQPFVENAIWHGLMNLPDPQAGKEYGEGNLDILLQQKDEILECVIVDNGVGRKAASELSSKSSSKYKSMGLQITKERIALLDNEEGGNSIKIEDIYDDNGNANGTKVTLRIKYKEVSEKVFL